MNQDELAQQLIDAAKQINSSGLNTGTNGNLSVRCGDGFLITPSGRRYEDLEVEQIPHVAYDGDWKGPCKPSSEWRFHRDIYTHRPEVKAIVHSHSSWCTTLACMGKSIPAFHYMIAVAGGADIRCADYATFGTQQLSDAALLALEDRKACLLGNHGMICVDSNLQQVLALAQEVEDLAKIYAQCLQLGEPNLLGSEEMARVLALFQDYKRNALS